MIEEKYIKIGERAMARDQRKYPFGLNDCKSAKEEL